MEVLGIPVPPGLLAAWVGWLAPARQPFFLTAEEGAALGLETVPRAEVSLSPELRDTFHEWNVTPEADRVAWLSEEDWGGLSPSLRRVLLKAQMSHGRGGVARTREFADLLPQLTGARFVWWPSFVSPTVLVRVVSALHPACEREQVPERVWQAAGPLLPRARELAGTFPHGSGPNCFGTVMGAAGVPGAEREWVQREPFETFLAERTQRGGHDDHPGTVLVWRNGSGQVQHAAVTLGDGWALHKPSQSWMTARAVLSVRGLIRYSRTRGWRLHRSRLRG